MINGGYDVLSAAWIPVLVLFFTWSHKWSHCETRFSVHKGKLSMMMVAKTKQVLRPVASQLCGKKWPKRNTEGKRIIEMIPLVAELKSRFLTSKLLCCEFIDGFGGCGQDNAYPNGVCLKLLYLWYYFICHIWMCKQFSIICIRTDFNFESTFVALSGYDSKQLRWIACINGVYKWIVSISKKHSYSCSIRQVNLAKVKPLHWNTMHIITDTHSYSYITCFLQLYLYAIWNSINKTLIDISSNKQQNIAIVRFIISVDELANW